MPEPPRLSLWRRGFLIAGLIWALAVVVPDLYRLARPLGTLGFTADNDGLVIDVEDGGPAGQAILPGMVRSLQSGDRIELGSAPCWRALRPACGSFLAVFGGMGGLTYVWPGTSVRLPIAPEYDRNIGSVIVNLVAAPAKQSWLDWIFLLADEIAGVLFVWGAFQLAWRAPSRMTSGFFLYAMWFNPGQYFTFYALLQAYPPALLLQEALQALAQGAGYAGFVVFALRFPHDATERRLRSLEPLAVALGATLAILQLWSFLNVFGSQTEIVTRFAILGGYAADLCALAVVVARMKSQTAPDYQRMRWVLWGCILGLPAFIFADSNEATTLWTRYVWSSPLFNGWSPPEWVFEMSYLISGLLAWGVCVAVQRPRVFDVSYRLRQLARGVVLLFVTGVTEEIVSDPLHELAAFLGLQSSMNWLVWLVSLLLSVATGERVSHYANHVWNRRYIHAAERLTEAGRGIRDGTRLERLEETLVREPVHALRLTSAALFRRGKAGFQRCEALIGWEGAAKMTAMDAEDATLIAKLSHADSIDVRRMHWRAPGVPSGPCAPALAVAIRDNLLFAFALYGCHDTGDDIDPAEEKLLCQLAGDAAHGYLVAELRRLQAAGATT